MFVLTDRDQSAAPRPIARRRATVILDHARLDGFQAPSENKNGFPSPRAAQNQIRCADEKPVAENVAAGRHYDHFARTCRQRLFERRRIVRFAVTLRAEVRYGNLFSRNAIRLLAAPVARERKIRQPARRRPALAIAAPQLRDGGGGVKSRDENQRRKKNRYERLTWKSEFEFRHRVCIAIKDGWQHRRDTQDFAAVIL